MNILIQNALSYYDKNMHKYKKIFDKVDHSKALVIENKHDLEPDMIELFDKNGKKLLTATTERIGKFINNLWIWCWALMFETTKRGRLSKKILDYGVNLILIESPKFKEQNFINMLLKTELVTSRIFIMNKLHFDIHLAISSYICKNPIIFGLCISEEINIYDYYFLSNIKLEN
mgnify:CR=1 FL=1